MLSVIEILQNFWLALVLVNLETAFLERMFHLNTIGILDLLYWLFFFLKLSFRSHHYLSSFYSEESICCCFSSSYIESWSAAYIFILVIAAAVWLQPASLHCTFIATMTTEPSRMCWFSFYCWMVSLIF